jgi:hypothetical protein
MIIARNHHLSDLDPRVVGEGVLPNLICKRTNTVLFTSVSFTSVIFTNVVSYSVIFTSFLHNVYVCNLQVYFQISSVKEKILFTSAMSSYVI